MRPLGVVLLSGGMDSCVTTAVACQRGDVALLHVGYGQLTQARERKAFDQIAAHYQVPLPHRRLVSIDYLGEIGGSALTDPRIAVPPAGGEGLPATYVPFRNAHLLSIGVSWAEVLGASAVYLGVVEDDGSGYPDCTAAFCAAFGRAVAAGTAASPAIRILTPVIHRPKSEIVQLGMELAAPLHLTWSCYTREDEACGWCDSCVLRLRAFREAGHTDPLPYASPHPR